MIPKILVFACFCVLLPFVVGGESDAEANTFLGAKPRSASAACTTEGCNRYCRRVTLGQGHGVCIGNWCRCINKKARSADEPVLENNQAEEIEVSENAPQNDEASSDSQSNVSTFADVIKSRSARSTCGYDSCNRFCRKLGHARGVCIGNLCQCRFRRRRSTDDADDLEKSTHEIANEEISDKGDTEPSKIHTDVSSDSFADVILTRSRRSCGAGECNAHCKKLGHARGVCIGTYCQCRSRLPRSLEDAQDNASEDDIQVDEKSHATNEDQLDVSSGSFADVILSRSRRSCGAGECNAHCKKLGHARGVCIGTYCQCRSRLRRSVAQAGFQNVIAHPQGFPRCVLYLCIRSCQRRGFKNGANCSIRGCQCRP